MNIHCNRVLRLSFTYLTFCFTHLFSQSDSLIKFYPLAIGNVWQYHSTYNYRSNFSYSYYTVEVVGDTLTANGKRYSIVRSSNNSRVIPRYQRVDSLLALVFAYDSSNGGIDRLIDSLPAPVMKGFLSYRTGYSTGFFLNKIDSMVYFGKKRESRRYTMPMGIGPGLAYSLTEQLGMTKIYNLLKEEDQVPIEIANDTLTYAKINGISYGSLVSVPNSETRFSSFELFQNYPNPFNPVTVIQYNLQAESEVRLILFNVLGQEVAVLDSGLKNAGNHKVTFNGNSLSTGIYYYRLQSGQFVESKKLGLIK